MKKRILTTMSSVLAVASIAFASGQWGQYEKIQAPQNASEGETPITYLGYCSPSDMIWPLDGLSIDRDGRVGVGIMLPEELVKQYAGTKIVSMYVGYDDEYTSSYYECFVKEGTFNGETIASSEGEVYFGWNNIEMGTPVEITEETGALCAGFYMEASANLCQIPKLYPLDQANSCYLWDGELDENGAEKWYDYTGIGTMTVVLVLSDEEGNLKNFITINNFESDVIVDQNDEEKIGVFSFSNKGSNSISSVEVTTTFGEVSKSYTVEFEKGIGQSSTVKANLPIYCLGTGEHTISFTKVNDETPKNIATTTAKLIGVPEEVSSKYDFRPVLQYFVSEENYMTPSYIDELLMPAFEDYQDYFTLVMPHLDDKYSFLTDNEEEQVTVNGQVIDDLALLELIDLAGDDAMKVSVPQYLFNRSYYTFYVATIGGTPFHNGTPYPEAVKYYGYYDTMLTYPTFASVNIESELDESGENMKVKVFGDVAEGIMPADEPLYLTVYVTENDVLSEDQLFWDDKEKGELNGEYTHKTIIREILTPYWGEQLEKTGGDYSKEFTVALDSEWDLPNVKVVAFLNRGKDNDHMNRQIINSSEAFAGESGVEGLKVNDQRIEISGGTVLVGGHPATDIYNLSGVKVSSSNLPAGIYIVKTDNGCKKIFVR